MGLSDGVLAQLLDRLKRYGIIEKENDMYKIVDPAILKYFTT